MEDDDEKRCESAAGATLSDLGPWCMGLPAAGTHRFSTGDLSIMRRSLLKMGLSVSAWLVPLPLGAVAIAAGCHCTIQSALPGLMLAGIGDLLLALALLATQDNPLWRFFLTIRDYRSGRVEKFEGKCDRNKYEDRSNPLESLRTQTLRYHTFHNLFSSSAPVQYLCRLPLSGRILSINDMAFANWLEVRIDGVKAAPNPRVAPDIYTPGVGGDTGCFIFLMIVLATVTVYNIWEPPWYLVAMTFVSLLWVTTTIINAIIEKYR